MPDVECALPVHNHLGEGAIWSHLEQALYWVDITNGVIHRWNPLLDERQNYSLGFNIGCLGLRAGGGLVLATKRGFAVWDAAAGVTPIANPNYARPAMRFNDGKVDRAGRFYAGTMRDAGQPAQPGVLYRLDADASLHVMQEGVSVPNGIGWSLDNRTMYFTDTTARTIFAYDYDPATGDMAKRRAFIVVPADAGEGGPDGLTVDSEGCIWSARWGGWKVVRYDPDGKIEREVRLPVERPTSCAFGGRNLDELFITSAALDITPEERQKQPWAGGVLRIHPGVKGRQEPLFAG